MSVVAHSRKPIEVSVGTDRNPSGRERLASSSQQGNGHPSRLFPTPFFRGGTDEASRRLVELVPVVRLLA
jgi:hypothetical protein